MVAADTGLIGNGAVIRFSIVTIEVGFELSFGFAELGQQVVGTLKDDLGCRKDVSLGLQHQVPKS